jgi:hypothetical protein
MDMLTGRVSTGFLNFFFLLKNTLYSFIRQEKYLGGLKKFSGILDNIDADPNGSVGSNADM